MKYLKIVLSILLISCFCALSVAGVNFFTAPKIEQYKTEQRLKSYKEIFPELDGTTSEILTKGKDGVEFKSSFVTEKVIAKDAAGTHLGFCVATTGKNTYGPISLTVGIDAEGKLVKIVVTENAQTGGRNDMINTWVDSSFTEGMSQTDVDALAPSAGATFGSNLVKNLVNAAFAEAGIMSAIQEELIKHFGDSVDMGASVEDTTFIYPQQIKLGYEVKNANGETLGYFYKLSNDNVVVLNANKEALESNTGNAYEIALVKEEIAGKWNIDVAVSNLFGPNTTTEALELTDNQKKLATELHSIIKNGKELAKLVVVNGTVKVPGTEKAPITIAVVINNANKLYGVFLLENGQTAGRADAISKFIGNSFEMGMTGVDTQTVKPMGSATLGSNLVLELLANAFEVVTSERPEKPVLGYDTYYADAFDGVDLSKTKKVEGIDDPKVKEVVDLFDKDENLLGRALILTDKEPEFSGVVEMMVAIDKGGKLAKVTIITNSHSAPGIDMNGYENNFKPGMGASEIDGVANIAGATLTSKMIKSLVKLAFQYAGGAYNDYYVQAFANIDLNKSEEIKDIKDSHITSALKAKDSEGNDLGKIYMVRLVNVHSWHVFMVALDNNGAVVKVIDVETDHGQMGADKLDVLNGATIDTLDKVVIAQGTYSVEIVKLAVRTAMVEFGKTHSTNSVELIMKDFFPEAVWGLSNKEVTSGFKNTQIISKYEVKSNVVKVTKTVGYLYTVKVESNEFVLTLMVGVDTNKNVTGARLIKYTNKTNDVLVGGAFKDTARGYTEAQLAAIKSGTSLASLTSLPYKEGNMFITNLLRYAFSVLLSEVSGKVSTYDTARLYDFTEVYNDLYDGINLFESELILDTKNQDVLQKFVAKDFQGKVLGTAYLVYVNNVYSHNYVLVVIEDQMQHGHLAKNQIAKFMDIQNDHAAISGSLKYFKDRTDIQDILDVYPLSGSSYSIDIIRLAAEKAYVAHTNDVVMNNNIKYEMETTKLFPYMVEARSYVVSTTKEQAKTIPYGYVVYGVENYQAGKHLGYSLVINVNGTEVVVAFNTKGEMIATKFAVLGNNEALSNVLGAITTNVNKDNINTVIKDETLKAALNVAFDVVATNAPLTKYDASLFKAYPTYSTIKSEVIVKKDNKFNNKEVSFGITVKDSTGKVLGTAYLVTVTNIWADGNNVMLVCLDANGNYHDLYDVEWHHSSASKDIFTSGSDLAAIEKALDDYVASKPQSGTMSYDLTGLAIKIAINEHINGANPDLNVVYESEAKRLFTGIIMPRSIKLNDFVNKGLVTWGLKAHGPKDYVTGKDYYLGNVYVVETTYRNLTLTVMFAIDNEGKLFKANVLGFDYSNYGYLGDYTIDFANKFLAKFEGKTLEEALKYGLMEFENLLIDKCAFDALLIAYNEFAGTKYVASEENIFKPLLEGSFKEMVDLDASTQITEIKDKQYVLDAYNVVGISGNVLGKVVFVNASNTYAEAYYRVSIDAQGRLALVTEISNNHGSNKDTCKEFSGKELTYEKLNEMTFSAHSFTFEQVKLAAKIAMVEANGLTVVDTTYENAAKQLLPYMVWQHSKELKNPAFTFGMLAKGTHRFGNDNCFLGYVFAFEVNGLELMVSFDYDNNLFPLDYWGSGNKYPHKVMVLKNTSKFTNEEVINFFNGYNNNIKDASKLDANTTGLDAELRKAINAKLAELIKLVGGNLLLSLDKFEGADLAKSEVMVTKQPEVLTGVKFVNANGDVLGYAMTIKLTNLWSEGDNIFVVLLDKDAKFKTLFDIEYHHGSMVGQADEHGPANIDHFKPGWTAQDIDKFLSGVSGGTMTKEMAALGIKLAMNEVLGHTNTSVIYEAAAKQIYQGMITIHNVKLTTNNQAIKWAYEIHGVNGYDNVTKVLGKAYVVELNGKSVLVGFDVKGNIQGVYDFETKGLVKDFAGLDKAKVEASTHALKDLVLKAFVELGGNN